MADVETRRLRATEWRELRDLRLRALQDTPLAFGSTYEREAAYTDERWGREAAAGEAGVEQVAIVAVTDGALVGMARGYLASPDEAGPDSVVWLIGVFVDPAYRGMGLAQALSGQVIDWARERSAAAVLLHVADWNAPARRTYVALGFTPTGARTTLAHDATIPEAEMRLAL